MPKYFTFCREEAFILYSNLLDSTKVFHPIRLKLISVCLNLTPNKGSLFMGITSGSLSISRFKIIGSDTPGLPSLNASLQKYVGKELKLRPTTKEQEARWVRPAGIIEGADDRTGSYWDLSDCEIEDGYFLKMRGEKRKVPGELLNSLTEKEVGKIEKRRTSRLSTNEKRALKEDIKLDLIKQALPTVGYVEVFWKWEIGEIWLLSTAKTTKQLFTTLFEKTFLPDCEARLYNLEAPFLGNMNSTHKENLAFIEKIEKIVPFGLFEIPGADTAERVDPVPALTNEVIETKNGAEAT